MTKKTDETIATEVISRLDELFGDEEVAGESEELFASREDTENEATPAIGNKPTQPEPAVGLNPSSGDTEPGETAKNLFAELDAIVLSIEWEITDEIMKSFINEVNRLKALYRDDRFISMFLQLHGTIGKYISTNKAQSHPDSMRLLNSVYNRMKTVLNSPDMSETEKKKLLASEVKMTKELKKKILLAKSRTAPVDQPAALAKPSPPVSTGAPSGLQTEAAAQAAVSPQAFDHAIEEIKATVRTEIASLKKELKAIISNL